MKCILLSACLICATASLPAFASDSGWYLGADIGHAEAKADDTPDMSDTAFGLHGGYQINRHFAVEGGYADLGKSSHTLDSCGLEACVPEQFPVDVELSGQRWELSLQGRVPFGENFEAYAKAGVARTEVEVEARSLAARSHAEDSSSDAIYGVGLRLHFDAPWSLRLQWDRTTNVGDDGTDIDGWWLGAEYRFAGN